MAEDVPGGQPRRHPSRRPPVLHVVLVVVVLAGLLWGADALARVGAQSLLARNVQDAAGVETPPVVRVRGAFFLPQVIRGRYNRVEVDLDGITSGPLRIDRLDSRLSDVRVPFHDVLVRDVRAVGIGRSEETARLRYDDLNAYFRETGSSLTLSAADAGRVRLTGTVDVLGQRLQVATNATLSVANGQLTLTPDDLQTGTADDPATRLLLAQRLRLTVPLGTLPFGQELQAVTADPDGLTVQASGTAVVLRP